MNVDQSPRSSALVSLAAMLARVTALWDPNVSKNTLMPVRHMLSRSASPVLCKGLQCGVGLVDHAVQQRQQHRFFGREVEVERRPRDAGTLGQVIDRDVGQRTAPRAAARRWPGSPVRDRRRTGVAAAAAEGWLAAGVSHGGQLTLC